MTDPLEQLRERMASLPRAELEKVVFKSRAALARDNDSPEGFAHFFWCLNGKELAPYALNYWLPEIYAAHADNTGVLLEAFRGSTKSTVGMAFDLFRIGHNPKGSGLIVGANDDAANKISAYLAAVIDQLPGWREVFPTIVPDKERGWGAQGYFYKDTSVPYDKWVEMTLQDHGRDPSFVAAGVTSSDIPGMHPSNFLHIDDVHDEKNTTSPREKAAVIASVRKNILPTMSRPGARPFMHIEYTPWIKDDAYQVMEETHMFHHIKTPLYVEDDNGVEYDGKRVRFADWPEFIGPKFADDWRGILNDRATFSLMMLLDREGAQKERIFKYYHYRNEMINTSWPMIAGVDYASVYKPSAGNAGGRSHFAMCYALKSPEGNVVIYDGILEQVDQADAEEYALSAQRLYQGFLNMVIEMDGKGSDFFQLMARHPKMKVIPKSTGGRNKSDRLYKTMSPWFANGKVRISDGDSKYLRGLRSFLDKYPNLGIHDPEWDAADACYYALLGMPDVLQVPDMGDELPGPGQRQEHRNPWAAAGRVGASQ